MKKAWDMIKTISAVIVVLGGIATGIWLGFDLDSRAFSSMEKRANGENILEAIDPTKLAAQEVRDSVYMEDTKKSREEKAKELEEIKERLKEGDSINLLNAEQISILRTENEARDSAILKAIRNIH